MGNVGQNVPEESHFKNPQGFLLTTSPAILGVMGELVIQSLKFQGLPCPWSKKFLQGGRHSNTLFPLLDVTVYQLCVTEWLLLNDNAAFIEMVFLQPKQLIHDVNLITYNTHWGCKSKSTIKLQPQPSKVQELNTLYRSKTRKPAIIVSNLHKILEYMTPATWVEAIEDRRQALSINQSNCYMQAPDT